MTNPTRTHNRPSDVADVPYLASRLDVSPDTIYALANAGKLQGIVFRVGRCWRVSVPALNRAIEAGTLDLGGATHD